MEKSEELKKYEEERDIMRLENEQLLRAFNVWLINKSLSNKVIRNHFYNAKYYIDEYLVYYYVHTSIGYEDVRGFFTFCKLKIDDCDVKPFYTSVKKYYTFLYEKKLVDDEIMESVKKAKEFLD